MYMQVLSAALLGPLRREKEKGRRKKERYPPKPPEEALAYSSASTAGTCRLPSYGKLLLPLPTVGPPLMRLALLEQWSHTISHPTRTPDRASVASWNRGCFSPWLPLGQGIRP